MTRDEAIEEVKNAFHTIRYEWGSDETFDLNGVLKALECTREEIAKPHPFWDN